MEETKHRQITAMVKKRVQVDDELLPELPEMIPSMQFVPGGKLFIGKLQVTTVGGSGGGGDGGGDGGEGLVVMLGMNGCVL